MGSLEWLFMLFFFEGLGLMFVIGVMGKEWVFVDEENKNLFSENDFEVEDLFDFGMFGMMSIVFLLFWVGCLFLKFRWGSKFLMDEINFVEFGLGGNFFLVEVGFGMFILVKLYNVFFSDRMGIFKDESFGRFVFCCIKVVFFFFFF